MITSVDECPVKVYGLLGHSNHVTLELPKSMLNKGEVFGFHEKYYQVQSILKSSDESYCVNVNWLVNINKTD